VIAQFGNIREIRERFGGLRVCAREEIPANMQWLR
jgi:hypothetical protein